MLLDEYVVLRTEGREFDVLGTTRGGPGTTEAIHLGKETLSSGDLDDLRQERDFFGAARALPIRPVKPSGDDDPDVDEAPENGTWGLEAVGALSSHRTGAGVTVAVLDTGINADHDAFKGKNIVQEDFTGEGDGDEHGHGTHCAGTIFGGEVGGRRIGVAPDIERALIGRVWSGPGKGSTTQILEGLLWAARKRADVISMSLELDLPSYVSMVHKLKGVPVEHATALALEVYRENLRLFDKIGSLIRTHDAMFSRCLVVAAAGNQSRRPDYEVGVDLPAAADGVLSVGALGPAEGSATELTVYRTSNSGPDLAAPGVGVESARHDNNSGLRSKNGTSMAAPHVAGVAALWIEEIRDRNPQYKINQIEANLLARTRVDVFAEGAEPTGYGAGLVQAPQR
ncbi:MAG: S8 family serine peptidase [bacterium]|nr:S8 family serine peptidase [bacterium]